MAPEPQRVGRGGPVSVPGLHLPALSSPPHGARVRPRHRAVHRGQARDKGTRWLSPGGRAGPVPRLTLRRGGCLSIGLGSGSFLGAGNWRRGSLRQSSVGTLAARWVCDLPTSSLDVPLWRTKLLAHGLTDEAVCGRGPAWHSRTEGTESLPVCFLLPLLVSVSFLGPWSSSVALGISDSPGPCPRPPLPPGTSSLGDIAQLSAP